MACIINKISGIPTIYYVRGSTRYDLTLTVRWSADSAPFVFVRVQIIRSTITSDVHIELRDNNRTEHGRV